MVDDDRFVGGCAFFVCWCCYHSCVCPNPAIFWIIMYTKRYFLLQKIDSPSTSVTVRAQIGDVTKVLLQQVLCPGVLSVCVWWRWCVGRWERREGALRAGREREIHDTMSPCPPTRGHNRRDLPRAVRCLLALTHYLCFCCIYVCTFLCTIATSLVRRRRCLSQATSLFF